MIYETPFEDPEHVCHACTILQLIYPSTDTENLFELSKTYLHHPGTTRKPGPSELGDDLYSFISKAEFHTLHTNHMLVDLGDDSNGNFYARKRYVKVMQLLFYVLVSHCLMN